MNLHQNKPPTWLVHIPGHPWVLGQATGTSDHKTHHGPDSGVCHHHTPYSILCDAPWGLHPNGTNSRDSQNGVPKLSRNRPGWSPGTLGGHNSRLQDRIAMSLKAQEEEQVFGSLQDHHFGFRCSTPASVYEVVDGALEAQEGAQQQQEDLEKKKKREEKKAAQKAEAAKAPAPPSKKSEQKAKKAAAAASNEADAVDPFTPPGEKKLLAPEMAKSYNPKAIEAS
ncbi:unnamed protein product [Sphagnum jensenii]